MELDRKVREFPIPEHAAQVASSVTGPVPTLATDDLPLPQSMSRFVMAHAREVSTSRCFTALDNQSHDRGIMDYSIALPTSKFLCAGHHRESCQSAQESVCAVVSGHVPGILDDTADDWRTVCAMSAAVCAVLVDLDVWILRSGSWFFFRDVCFCGLLMDVVLG